MKTLNVKKTSIKELENQWGMTGLVGLKGDLYIRCDKDGIINWDKAHVYSSSELVGRDGVNLIK